METAALAILLLIAFGTGVWCGTGLGRELEKKDEIERRKRRK